MHANPVGLTVPLVFSTTRSRQVLMELYFSPKAMKPNMDTPALVKTRQASELLYRKQYRYGDHQFLVPVRCEATPSMIDSPRYLKSDGAIPFGQIGKDPTTAVAQQRLQLMPCSQSNLDLISTLQQEPFYIEITKNTFNLHVWHQGTFWKIPSQRQAPKIAIPHSPFSQSHPGITLHAEDGPIQFMNFREIPWTLIATQFGHPAEVLMGNWPSSRSCI